MKFQIIGMTGLCLSLLSTSWAQPPRSLDSAIDRCSCKTASSPPLIATSAQHRDSAKPSVPPTVQRSASSERSPLQIAIPESMLNRLLTEDRHDTGSVNDVIANAEVVGRQRTVTRVQVDCRPSELFAEIHLVLTGTVQSDTLGLTRQAAVNTLGQHDVVAIKPVMFDGHQITTKRAKVWVDVRNHHVAASTPLDGVPLLNAIARSMAITGAEQRREVADSETAARLSDRIGPEFNREADRKLARFNRSWRDQWKSQLADWWPSQISPSSTESHLLLSAAWSDVAELNASTTNLETHTLDNNLVTLRVHESVLNAGLRKLDLAGKTISERELRRAIEDFVAQWSGRVIPTKTSPNVAVVASPVLRFAEKNPARVQFVGNQWRLIINASVEVAGQTVLSQDEITLPFTAKMTAREWRVHPEAPLFAKAGQGFSLVGAMASLVRSQLAASLPEVALPIAISFDNTTSNRFELRLQSTTADSGWFTASWIAVSAQQPTLTEPVPEFVVPKKPEPRTPRIPQDLDDSSARSRSRATHLRTIRDPRGWFE